MDLKHRMTKALREDANILGLAGSAALSLALLNPLPLLVGLVAEAVYLMYVPDSRWYATRLAYRYDRDVTQRRRELRAKYFEVQDQPLVSRLEQLEVLRAAISAEKPSDETRWLKLLRQTDYLLELQIQMQGTAARVSKQIAPTDHEEAVAEQIAERSDRLRYYETAMEVLHQVSQELPEETAKTDFKDNITQLEWQQSDTQREMFHIIAAEHLIENANVITGQTGDLLEAVIHETGEEAIFAWEQDAARLIHESEMMTRRLSDWLKQNR